MGGMELLILCYQQKEGKGETANFSRADQGIYTGAQSYNCMIPAEMLQAKYLMVIY